MCIRGGSRRAQGALAGASAPFLPSNHPPLPAPILPCDRHALAAAPPPRLPKAGRIRRPSEPSPCMLQGLAARSEPPGGPGTARAPPCEAACRRACERRPCPPAQAPCPLDGCRTPWGRGRRRIFASPSPHAPAAEPADHRRTGARGRARWRRAGPGDGQDATCAASARVRRQQKSARRLLRHAAALAALRRPRGTARFRRGGWDKGA